MKQVKEMTMRVAAASVTLGPKYKSISGEKFYRLIVTGNPVDMGFEEQCVVYREESDVFNSNVLIMKKSDFDRNFIRA